MDNINILYDHYKETNKLQLAAIKRRNRNFLILCILEAVAFLIVIRPEVIFADLIDGINTILESSLKLTNDIIQSFVWICIIYVQMRYIQDTLYIERQYNYIDILEKELSKYINTEMDRESDNYFNNYPIVLNLIDLFYKMFCPILFCIINVVHISEEWGSDGKYSFLIIDTVLCILSLVIMWFYFFEVHSKITLWFKDHFPPIRWLADLLRKVLKEV